MIIASPPSYLAPADLLAAATGVPATLFAALQPAQQQAILNAATSRADAIMGRSMLAREETRYYQGDGTQTLDVDESPIVYVRQIAFSQPGLGGLVIPTENILVDYAAGELITFTPLLLQGAGYVARFPVGVELSVRLGFGYNYAVPPPLWTASDALPDDNGALEPGQYVVAITSATFSGESTATPQNVTTESGAIALIVQSVLGAERYRVYAGVAGTPAADLVLVGEIQATSFTSGPLGYTFSALAAPYGMFPEPFPLTDTTAQQVPGPVVEATRLLAIDMLYEDANPANVGISADGDTHFRRGEDSAAKSSGSYLRAAALLGPYRYVDVF